MAIDRKLKFETVCSLTADYVRAYMQNTNFKLTETTLTDEHVNTCFNLAKLTVELFEKEYQAENIGGQNNVLH